MKNIDAQPAGDNRASNHSHDATPIAAAEASSFDNAHYCQPLITLQESKRETVSRPADDVQFPAWAGHDLVAVGARGTLRTGGDGPDRPATVVEFDRAENGYVFSMSVREEKRGLVLHLFAIDNDAAWCTDDWPRRGGLLFVLDDVG